MFEFLRDVRFGFHLLRSRPVFAITVILLLGIGIGANTLVFSLVDTLLLRPLPVKEPGRLVRLIEVHPTGFVTWDLPLELYGVLAKNSSNLKDALCQGNLDVAFESNGSTDRIRINAVSGNFFSALGIPAHLGRVLTPNDDASRAMEAVLSYEFWQKRLSGSADAIGRVIRLNGHAFTVAGVLPRGVNGLTVDTAPDIRIPLSAGRMLAEAAVEGPVNTFNALPVQIFARLRPGVGLERAEAEIEPRLRPVYEDAMLRAFPELAKVRRQDVLDSRLRLERAGNGISALREQFSRGMELLMCSVALLLLMACGNVACLLLARSVDRSQEISMRFALGATRERILRQLLTESLLVAMAGGALGVLLAFVCQPLLLAALPPIRDRAAVLQPMAVHIDLNLRILIFAIAASVFTAVLFGVAPALAGMRQDPAESLRGSRTSTGRMWGRNTLLAAQVAICVLMLAGAGVLVTTFDHMHSMNAGFDRDHVVTFSIDPGLKGYKPDEARRLSRQILEKTRILPGVTAAAIAARGVMRGTGLKLTLGIAGTPIKRDDFLNSSGNSVTPGYFDAMGMRIPAGRDFQWSDDPTKKPALVIVNEAFVRHFFPGRDAEYAHWKAIRLSRSGWFGGAAGSNHRSCQRCQIPISPGTGTADRLQPGRERIRFRLYLASAHPRTTHLVDCAGSRDPAITRSAASVHRSEHAAARG